MLETTALTLYLLPLPSPWRSTMRLVSSPKARIRAGTKEFSTVPPPPQDASRSAATSTPQALAAWRISLAFNLIQFAPGVGKAASGPPSGCRSTVQTVAHAFPFRTRRRFLDPDEMHALAIEFAQDGKQLDRKSVVEGKSVD